MEEQKGQKLARVEKSATGTDIGETWKQVLSVVKNVKGEGASLMSGFCTGCAVRLDTGLSRSERSKDFTAFY